MDKEIAIQEANQSVTTIRERLNKNPVNYAINAIDFLNGLTEEELRKTNITNMISIITWDRKVVNQHQRLDTIEAKIGIMAHEVKYFIEIFNPLVKMGLPFFWEEKGGMLSQKEYHDRMIRYRSDHSKFTDM